MTHHTDAERALFEAVASDNGKWPKAIERDANGNYLLMQTASGWAWWQVAWQAARRAPAVPVPQGWKLVPVEPTEDMMNAFRAASTEEYRAMLAAAPRPPEAALVPSIAVTPEMVEAANEAYCPFGDMELALCAALQVAPIPPGADHIPDAGKMDANVHNRMKAALSKDVACPACGLSGLHACPSASTTAPHCPDAATALEKVLRAVQRHLPPERIGERETIAEIISIVDPWPLGKPPEPWKDHMTAELVGKLTDVARQFHGTQQLRERIAGLVRPVCERIKQLDDDRMPEVDMAIPISVAAPVQLPEPVAFALEWTFNGEERGMRLYDDETHCRFDAESDGGVCHPLYTEQQVRQLLAAAKVERKPLTDEAIRTLYDESDGHWQMVGPQVLCFARSIESVHGIQEQST